MADESRTGPLGRTVTFAVLGLILAMVLIPYAYVIVTAFKSPGEVYEISWWPNEISFVAWYEVFAAGPARRTWRASPASARRCWR